MLVSKVCIGTLIVPDQICLPSRIVHALSKPLRCRYTTITTDQSL